ncbi:prepilin peptidase [Falsiroseomonas sp. CW058]|uniref:prepilin peptidase n=1 Tax=Falsiroseomonas sp. CW058 TaxID=3388664 RepID=UPI003D3172F3
MFPGTLLAVVAGAAAGAAVAVSVRPLAGAGGGAAWPAARFGGACGALLAALAAWLLPPGLWAAAALLGVALVGIAWLDLAAGVVHAALAAPLAVAGVALAALLPDGDAVLAAVGIVFGYGLLRLAEWATLRARGVAGIGRGDAWVLGALGAWVGPAGIGPVLAFAALLSLFGAAVLARGVPEPDRALPFAPALALAGWGVWLAAVA